MNNRLSKYIQIAKIGWLDAVEYRTDFFMSVFGWGIRLAIATFLWQAVSMSSGGQIGSYSYTSIMSYFFLVQILSSFVFSHVGFLIADDVYKGEFNQYLLKPVAYLPFRFLFDLSRNTFRTIVGALIFGVIIALYFNDITLTIEKIPLIILSMLGAYMINFSMLAILGLSSFWLDSTRRIIFIYFGMLTIFSGMIVPLNLFPPSYLSIVKALPFGYIFFFPVQVLQTSTITSDMWVNLGYQWLYAFGLALVCNILFRRGVKKFEGVGI